VRSKRFVGLLLAALLTVVVSGVAYAYGIQKHTVNGYIHGCDTAPGWDPGCTGPNNEEGNYHRVGHTWKSSGTAYYINTEIWRAGTNVFKVRTDCLNCYYTIVEWDTNPVWECRFKTWHVADSVAGSPITLSGHWHYTEAATGPNGEC
jgi:hypothetical protein